MDVAHCRSTTIQETVVYSWIHGMGSTNQTQWVIKKGVNETFGGGSGLKNHKALGRGVNMVKTILVENKYDQNTLYAYKILNKSLY